MKDDRYYIGVVDRGADGLGVWFPDCPGATSGGGTEQDLFRNAIEALALWGAATRAAGRPLPAPRPIDALRADAEVREAIAADPDVTFVNVPMLIEDARSVKATISLEAGLLASIDSAADRLGLTRSAFLASAARAKIERG